MEAQQSIPPSQSLVLLANYSPFLFVLGLIFGVMVHIQNPIGIGSGAYALFIQILGIIALLTTTVLFVWVHRIRQEFFTKIHDNNVCVEIRRGPYKVSRHPGALSLLLLMFGVACVLNSLALLLFTIILTAIFTWIIHPFQEMLLVKQCGDSYLEYKKHVRMWF